MTIETKLVTNPMEHGQILIAVRRPTGAVETVDITTRVGVGVFGDAELAKLAVGTREAGRGEIIAATISAYACIDCGKADCNSRCTAPSAAPTCPRCDSHCYGDCSAVEAR